MEDGDSIGDGEGDCDGDVDAEDEGVDNEVATDNDDEGNCDATATGADDPVDDAALTSPGEFELCDAILSSLNDFQLSLLYFRLFLAHGEGDKSRRDDTLTLIVDNTTGNDFPGDRITLFVLQSPLIGNS